MSYLTERQKAEMRQMSATGIARQKEKKIRDLARDLSEGRVPAADPGVRAALRELSGEIERVLAS